MRKIKIIGLLLVMVLIAGGCVPKEKINESGSGEIILGPKVITAKSGYEVALPEAKKFSADSYLVDLNTTGVEKNGKSNTWYILFYSPSKNTNYKVNVVEGKVDKTEEGDKKKKERVVDGWVDSTNVAEVAVPKCQEAGEIAKPDYFINLDPGKEAGNPVWNFNCLVGENKTFKVYVDALTGNFTKTGQAGIGW